MVQRFLTKHSQDAFVFKQEFWQMRVSENAILLSFFILTLLLSIMLALFFAAQFKLNE